MDTGKDQIIKCSPSPEMKENPVSLESMLIATSTSAVASLLRTVPPISSINSLASAGSSITDSKFEWNFLSLSSDLSSSSRSLTLSRRNQSTRLPSQKRGTVPKLKRLGTNSHGKILSAVGRGHRRSEDFSTPPGLLYGMSTSSESAPGTPLHDYSAADFSEPATPADRSCAADDLPEIEEHYPGKVCVFCNLGEKSQLGQGEMVKLQVGSDFQELRENYQPEKSPSDAIAPRPAPVGQRKPRLSYKGRRSSSFETTSILSELQEELSMVGHLEEPDLITVVEASGAFYAHRACLGWSSEVPAGSNDYTGADKAMLKAIGQRCSGCNAFGANLHCEEPQCGKKFHFPCAVSAGSFLNAKTSTIHCPDHIYQGSVIAGPEANCGQCNSPGNVSNQLFCVTCGKHYHGSCVGLGVVSDVRLGWQCSSCKVCITCRAPGEDSKMLACDTCGKSYHPYCVRPLLSNIPKMGWKCKNCRVCGDCGARTPGSGPSSRWHSCFTVCDSCYQQRNKGASCPLCGKAYRHSQREMTQCQGCRKYVHSGCDPESDRTLCQRKKEINPDYEYICPVCKQNQNNWPAGASESDSTAFLRGSQESLAPSEDSADMDFSLIDDSSKVTVPYRGKPYQSLGKVAKKKLTGPVGRPKGTTKTAWGVAHSKKPKVAEFGRKRGPKPKIRGVFGMPGVGLQRPQGDSAVGSALEGEPCLESRLILCSAQDDFVLEQDVCVMCGAFGVDQEGRLISCAQCGQCYHPYCANVKLNKVVLEKGWRCLDCTICEGCGQKNDEARLLLCDECDISYHIYCMDPPLDYVPQGNWKCKWCSVCQACGSSDPGVNSSWVNNYTLCGPCASLGSCAVCSQQYHEGELIVQCQQCERWLHGSCDSIRNENEAERCADDSYVCLLCRPAGAQPPHLNPASQASIKPPTTPPRSPASTPETPKPRTNSHFVVDGVCLSENGMNHLRTLQVDLPRRKSRAKGNLDSSFENPDGDKGDADADESLDLPKEGTVITPREDGRPPDVPEGYSVVQGEGGVLILRKKRQRNLQKLGIGGFQARRPSTRTKEKEEDTPDPADTPTKEVGIGEGVVASAEGPNAKPRRKPPRRKPKNKLAETYPSYLQEAFFGKDLLEVRKSESADRNSDSEKDFDAPVVLTKEVSVVQLTREEVAAMDATKLHQQQQQQQQQQRTSLPLPSQQSQLTQYAPLQQPLRPPQLFPPRPGQPASFRPQFAPGPRPSLPRVSVPEAPAPQASPVPVPVSTPAAAAESREMIEDVAEDSEALKDILPLASDLLDSDDLVDALMKEGGDDLAEDNHSDIQTGTESIKDELPDILNPHFNIENMVSETGLPNMDSKDVEDLFKGVLTDESQESADSSFIGINATPSPAPNAIAAPSSAGYPATGGSQHGMVQGPVLSRALSAPQGTASPGGLPPPSPYPSEYSNSSGFSPAFSEPPPSPWTGGGDDVDMPTVSQRNSYKWELDEALGLAATISAVLYANTNHSDLKRDFPNWTERWKQIAKIWRSLPPEKKAPFLQKARENRAAARLQKSQQQSQQPQGKSSNIGSSVSPSPPPEIPVTNEMPGPCEEPESATGVKTAPSSVEINRCPNVTPVSIGILRFLPTVKLVQAAVAAASPPVDGSPESTLVESGPDLHIRVLTPSEIMRTLPSLGRAEAESVSLDTEKNIPVHRRVVESEQEKQWKQLQMSRQQQQQQLPTATPTAENAPVNPPSSNVGPFAAPIQVTRVRPPELSGPLAPGALVMQRGPFPQQLRPPTPGTPGPRTPGPVQQPQPFDLNPAEMKVIEHQVACIKTEVQDPNDAAVDQNNAARQQLRDLLQRQQQQVKKEDLIDTGNQQMLQQQRFQQQFRFPLPPGSPVTRPMVNLPMNPQQQQQQMVVNQRPRMTGAQAVEFRQPVPMQVAADPRIRMMMQQRAGFMNPTMQPMNSNPTLMRPNLSVASPGAPGQQQQQQFHLGAQQMRPQELPINSQVKTETHGETADLRTAVPAPGPVEAENAEGEPDADLVDLGMDDDELLGLGSDFNILEYAGADLLEGQDGKGNVSNDEGGTGSPAMGTAFDLLEYADPELDTGDEGSRKNLLDEHLDLVDEDAKKEAEETAAKVAQGVSEFQAKLLEISQRQQQQQAAGVSHGADASNMARTPAAMQQVPDAFGFHQPAQLPPPYRCPPPPYPGPPRNQLYGMGRGQGLLPACLPHMGSPVFRPLGMGTGCIPNAPFPRRQDQRLLLEDLLEQEKREQRQQLTQQSQQQHDLTPEKPFLSDTDFEKLKSDVFGGESSVCVSPPVLANPHTPVQHLMQQHMVPFGKNPQQPHHVPNQNLPMQGMVMNQQQQRMPFGQHQMYPQQQQQPQPHVGYMRPPMQQQWAMQGQQGMVRPPQDPGIHPALLQTQAPPRPPMPPQLQPAPPPPPDNPTTDSERQQQATYEQWLNDQQQLVRMQQTYYETEVNKYRKQRKSLNSRQRQLRKNGQELNENDAAELERITTEQSALQKQLDQVRRQARQHNMLVQDYRGKQQKRQQQAMAAAGPVQSEVAFGSFPQQPQHGPPMQLQIHLQQQQQASPRAVAGPATPQSPHLLSPGHNIRGPHPPGQVGMQGGPPPSPIMIQQHSMGMVGPPPRSPMTPQAPQQLGNVNIRTQTPVSQQAPTMQLHQQQKQAQQPIAMQQYHTHVMQMQQGPPQSPRLQQQLHSPMMVHQATPQSPMMNQQPPPSPLLQQSQRPTVQQQPMPAPSPVTGMQHSPMPMSMTPTPSPGIPNPSMAAGIAGNHLQQHNPSPMAQHSPHTSMMSPRMGTPLSQRSEDAASPFSPGPLASPQPTLAGMRLTSPQNHPPRLPSPQQHNMPVGRVIVNQAAMSGNPMPQGNMRPQGYPDQIAGMRPSMSNNAGMHPVMMQRFARPTGPVQSDPSVMLRQRFPMQNQSIPAMQQQQQQQSGVTMQQQHFQHMQQQQQQQQQQQAVAQDPQYLQHQQVQPHQQQQHPQQQQQQVLIQQNMHQQDVSLQQQQQHMMQSNQQCGPGFPQQQQQQHQMQYNMMHQQQQQQTHYQQQYSNQQQNYLQQQPQHFQQQQQGYSGTPNTMNQPMVRATVNYGMQQVRSNVMPDNFMASPRPGRPSSVPQSPAPLSHPGTPAQPAASPASAATPSRASPAVTPGTPSNSAEGSGQLQQEPVPSNPGGGGGGGQSSQVIPFIEYDSYGFPKIGLKGGSPLSPGKTEQSSEEPVRIPLPSSDPQVTNSGPIEPESSLGNSQTISPETAVTSVDTSCVKEEVIQVKQEIVENVPLNSISSSPPPQEQNALLKQLLQGSSPPTPPATAAPTCSATAPRTATSLINLLAQSPCTSSTSSTSSAGRSLLGTPSLASQLAQPIAPPPLTIPTAQIAQIISRVPQPMPIVRPPVSTSTSFPRFSSTLSTLASAVGSAKSAQAAQLPQQLAVPPPPAIKEEVIDQQVAAVNQSPQLCAVKMETDDAVERGPSLDMGDQKKDPLSEEAKKAKRRQSQQKRRQSCAKDGAPLSAVSPGASVASGGSSPAFGTSGLGLPSQQAKKRLRKGSKYEEDYETCIDSMMTQLRTLPGMSIVEPDLGRHFTACPLFGAGDCAKLGDRGYPLQHGELKGEYGCACPNDSSDYYDTRPFGDLSPVVPSQPTQTQRGFYHQEFAWPQLGDDGSRSSTPCRDTDTPDTVISTSSPECVLPDPVVHYPGLKYIDDSDNEGEDTKTARVCTSPDIPLLAPVPIHAQTVLRQIDELDKENHGLAREQQALKARFGLSPPVPLRDTGNVTVTLTLSAAAAEDVTGVLTRLAALLRVPPPSGYEVIERTTTPPSQRLGLYRYKGKDGKEGVPVDIQSILNGTAKFCRHCDVVILGGNMICKKASQVGPGVLLDSIASGDEDVYFCSTACFVQFAVTNRVGLTPEQKAAAVVDHSSSRDPSKPSVESSKLDVKAAAAVANIFSTSTAIKKTIPAVTGIQRPSQQLLDRKARRSDEVLPPPAKKWKDVRYRSWSAAFQQTANGQKKFKKPRENELTEMLYRLGICIRPLKMPTDDRECMFCRQPGDGVSDGPARLLNYDVDRWVHLNCALWHEEVYETVNGALMNVDLALKASLIQNCALCERSGATVKCFKLRCSSVYHLGCAIKDNCVFYKNKTVYCSQHVPKGDKDDQLTTLSVFRRVYVNRDENRQVAAVVHHGDQNYVLRLGSLTLKSVGQLLPHQLAAFHTPSYIYPIGYQVTRFYWSPRTVHKRCRYTCTIAEQEGRPQFVVSVEERNHDDATYTDWTCQGVWQQILSAIEDCRRQAGAVRLFPQFLTGEDLFGLNEPAIIRLLESLPGIETLPDYNFKYGRNPLFELPLAINPTGCARAEPKLRTHFKRPHTQRTLSSARNPFNHTAPGSEPPGPYSKQFVHSKSSQYKKMKLEWRHNLYLARSKIQGLGLFAARDIEKHTMVIEYIGELIRAELAEFREKKYEAENRGIYMFRLDEQRVIDASLSGGLARYINHSCNPNCVAEAVEVERDVKIIIFANRRIFKGEELSYDYKFDIEDDHKIPCLCGAPNCRKWMN